MIPFFRPIIKEKLLASCFPWAAVVQSGKMGGWDAVEKKGLLMVSFGTAHPEALERDLGPVERAIQGALPEYLPVRAFGSGKVAQALRQREGMTVPTVREALEWLRQQGVRELVVQSAFLLPGKEDALLLEELGQVKSWFSSLRVGRPLLGSREDCLELAAGLAEVFPREKGPVVLMGHGTERPGNEAYSALAAALPEHLHLGIMEGEPGPEAVCHTLRSLGVQRVTLAPLLLAAGSHARREMASGRPDSWKSKLEAAGIQAECLLRGLGSRDFVQQMFARHALEAVSTEPTLDFSGIVDKLEPIS